MTPLEILQAAERKLGPNYTEDGYTETSIIPVIDAVRDAARWMDAQDLIIGMVWNDFDEDGFGGDSELMAFRTALENGKVRCNGWSIPVPFNSNTDLADVVAALQDACDNKFSSFSAPIGSMPRAFNYIW